MPTGRSHSTPRLDDVLVTHELAARPAPPADPVAEVAALHAVGRAMATGPDAGLRAVADAALTLCRAGSAGVSVLDAEADAYRWAATAGAYAAHAGGTSAGAFSPCGATAARGSPQLFDRPDRVFAYLADVGPRIVEALFVPFPCDDGGVRGTVWVAAHDDGRKFTAADARLLTGLAAFASAAVRSRATQRADEGRLARDAALLANVRDSVIVTDLNGFVTFWNDGATRLFGWTAGEMIGRPLADRLPEPARAEVAAWVERIAAGEAEFDGEWLDYRKDGSRVWIEATTRRIADAAGNPLGLMGVARDVSERKRAEAALAALAERHAREARVFDTTLSSIADFAYTFDRDGRFTYANRALLDLWGVTLGDVVGRDFFGLKYPDALAAKLQRQIREVFDAARPLTDETPYTSPTGAGGHYEYIFRPVLATDGSVESVAGSTRDVTRRKAGEGERDALRATVEAERAKLAAIIGQAPAFIAVLRGPDLVFEIANDRYYEIVGRREIIGRPIREALPEVAGQGFFELLDDVYRTGETFAGDEIPVLLRRDTGDALDRRYMNLVYQALREADGSVSGVFVHGVDVTDLVHARDASRAGEERLRQLADAMPQIVWAARADGVLDYYNRRWFEYIDRPPESAGAGDVAWDRYIHPDDLPRVYAEWAEAVRSGRDYATEFRVRRADGAYRWFLVRALPVRDAAGRAVARWYGTCTDVEDQRAAREALREGEERLRLGLRAGRAGTWDWDVAADRVTWSDRIYEFYGVAPGDFGGTVAGHARMVHPDDAARVGEAIAAALDGRAAYDTEFRIVRPDGTVRWIATTGEVYRGPGGEPLRMVGAAADVTERKEGEVARERLLASERAARADAEAANRAKDRHLAFLAHELRGPLTPALLAAAAMAADAALPEACRADAAMIRRNIELTTRLADDLLDANRIAHGKLALRVEATDVHDTVRAGVGMCAADSKAKGVRLALDLRATRCVADADAAKLTQVWVNLLKNAVKFTPAGGDVTVATSDVEGGRIRVHVRDTGAGVSADLLPTMFDLYEQGDPSVTREHGGLGLGLAICKGIVDAHGGTINAASAGRGHGTTVAVELALSTAPPTSANASGHGVVAGPPSASAEPLDILLVDDDADTLRAISRLLKKAGHRVTAAASVAAALDAASAGTFDVLISDLGLPDGSGLGLMRELLRRRPITGIALTGYGGESDVAETRDAGFVAHLVKPINFAQLEGLLGRVGRNA